MKRYNDENIHFKSLWGQRVQKIGVDGGFTCPNRDGSKARGGCTFCDNDAFSPFYSNKKTSISDQIKQGVIFYGHKYKATKFIAYFQSFSGTYDKIENLKQKYDEALSIPGIVGLTIATRPDCINQEIAELLASYQSKTVLTIELGLESCFNDTLMAVNRAHTFEDFKDACFLLDKYNIPVNTHLIFGLPNDDNSRIISQASILSQLPIDCLKIHQLQIMKRTAMNLQYQADPSQFKLFTANEYIDVLIQFIELLNPKIKIGRLISEVPLRYLVAPDWKGMKYTTFLNLFETELEIKNTYQGRLFE